MEPFDNQSGIDLDRRLCTKFGNHRSLFTENITVLGGRSDSIAKKL